MVNFNTGKTMASKSKLTFEKKLSIFFSNLSGVSEHIGREHDINTLKKNLEYAHKNNASEDEFYDIIKSSELFFCHFRHSTTRWNPLEEDFREFKSHPEKMYIWEESYTYPDEQVIRAWISG